MVEAKTDGKTRRGEMGAGRNEGKRQVCKGGRKAEGMECAKM